MAHRSPLISVDDSDNPHLSCDGHFTWLISITILIVPWVSIISSIVQRRKLRVGRKPDPRAASWNWNCQREGALRYCVLFFLFLFLKTPNTIGSRDLYKCERLCVSCVSALFIPGCFAPLTLSRHHGHPVLRHRDVPLHSPQPVPGHPDPHAANPPDCGLLMWWVLPLCGPTQADPEPTFLLPVWGVPDFPGPQAAGFLRARYCTPYILFVPLSFKSHKANPTNSINT